MLPSRRSQGGWLPGIFNDLFDNDWTSRMHSTAPAINIMENEKDYTVEVAAPGMKKDDFKIKLNEENQLVISLEKKEEHTSEKEPGAENPENTVDQQQSRQQTAQAKQSGEKKEGKYLRREFYYTQFQQMLVLPDDIERDKISAKMEDGVLTIRIPKDEQMLEKKKEKDIQIG